MPDGRNSLQEHQGKPPVRFIAFWISVLAFATIYTLLYGADSGRQLLVSLTADERGGFQVFFDHGASFSEQDSSRIAVKPGSNTYSIRLTEEPLKALRLDPDPTMVRVRLDKVVIQDRRSASSATLPLDDLTPLNDIASIGHEETGATVVSAPNAQDPQTLLPVHEEFTPRTWELAIGRACRGLLLLTVGLAVVLRLARPRTGVPAHTLLFGAWMLIAAMALTSTTSRSVHPDEFSHVAAARYYYSHWLPPRVDSPEIIDSYSAYGASYLNELDLVYPIAAKASQLWSVFGLAETTSLRFFNVLLFGGLVAIAATFRKSWPTCVVLLLTPQVWYVFSYFNADGFALFLALMMTTLFAATDSPVSRFIDGQRVSRVSLGFFAITLGLLLVSKRNYLPVVLVTGLVLAARHLGLKAWTCCVAAIGAGLLSCQLVAGKELVHMFPLTSRWFAPVGLVTLGSVAATALWRISRQPALRLRLYRLVLLFVLAAGVATPRVVADIATNGGPLQKSQRMSAAAEEYAQTQFKPSTLVADLSASYPGLKPAAKGTSFWQIVGPPNEWSTSSWYSLLGVYGYMSIFAPQLLYALLSTAILLLCVSMATWAFRHANARTELSILVSGATLVVLNSILQSWANDFQPQGRYLFPALVMIAAYLQSQPELSKSYAFRIGVAACFAGSVLSFATVALPALAGR